jgi:hypothetical protein
MRRPGRLLPALWLAVCLPVLGAGAWAAGGNILLNLEPGGDIDKESREHWDGVFENHDGSLVWNGTEWISHE